MSVVITGASGHLGRQTAEFVLERTPPSEVILTTRSPTALDNFADQGVQVRHADFNQPSTVAEAFDGADRLLLISTDAVGSRVPQHEAAIDAAADAGIEHIIYTSMPSPVLANPSFAATDHWATEQALRESGLTWTALRNGMYAENVVKMGAPAVAINRYVTNSGDGRTAYVAREDCAAVAAAVLTDDGHENVVYDITGPDLVTGTDITALLEDITAHSIEHISVDDEEIFAGLRANGLSAEEALGATSWGAAIREGYLDQLTSTVEDLTGRQPRSLRNVLAEHRDELVGS